MRGGIGRWHRGHVMLHDVAWCQRVGKAPVLQRQILHQKKTKNKKKQNKKKQKPTTKTNKQTKKTDSSLLVDDS